MKILSIKSSSFFALVTIALIGGCAKLAAPPSIPVPAAPTFTVTPTVTNTAIPATFTPTPTVTATNSPSNTPTLTPTPGSPTDTPTNSPSNTPTNTRTNSPTATPTNTGTQYTPTMTVTSTVTGCAKVSVTGSGPLPVNPASAGTTATGLSFNIFRTDAPCGPGDETHYLTEIHFAVTTTGNLDTQISQVQLYQLGALVGSTSFSSSGLTITGSPIASEGPFDLSYVFSSTASGTIQTTINTNGVYGYGNAGFFAYFISGPVTSGALTVH